MSLKPLNPFEPVRGNSHGVEDARNVTWENQDAAIRTCQIIVIALAMGIVTFATVAVPQGGLQVNLQPGNLSWVGLIATTVAIPLSFLIPRIAFSFSENSARDDERREDKITKLFAAFQTQLIIGCALLEGPGFLNLIAFQREHCTLSLVAFALCLGLLLQRVPSKWRVQSWIGERLQN